jgi:hypothetical protein
MKEKQSQDTKGPVSATVRMRHVELEEEPEQARDSNHGYTMDPPDATAHRSDESESPDSAGPASGGAHVRTGPIAFPRSVWLILGTELCER